MRRLDDKRLKTLIIKNYYYGHFVIDILDARMIINDLILHPTKQNA
jgi:hypothetical protein